MINNIMLIILEGKGNKALKHSVDCFTVSLHKQHKNTFRVKLALFFSMSTPNQQTKVLI